MSQNTQTSVNASENPRVSTVRVLPQGMVNVFLIEGDGLVLVDTGLQGGEKRVLRALAALGVDPRKINLIIATHNHEDHIGAMQALRGLTGAKTAMSGIDRDVMEGRLQDDITPLTSLAKLIFRLRGVKTGTEVQGADRKASSDASAPAAAGGKQTPTPVIDIAFTGPFDLRPYGIAGDALPTPGHTKGSISILLEDGSAIIGDSLMAMLPWSRPGKPMLAHNLPLIRENLRMLLDKGANRFYLSHGKPFGREDIEKALLTL